MSNKIVRGSDLRQMRNMAGLRTIDMAAAAGVKTRKTYENWEKEMGAPNVNQFFSMAKACGLSAQSIMEFYEFKEQMRGAGFVGASSVS
ncbi:helix-turn-helix transcriptional regulator [Alteromonas sp. a30]|uniref:helix-turn-helix transcriptional regulator n=1 Tax=Alteromonas sp. a30 TaxID=2730917 RepID=UPI00227FE7AF|nr:helix-turn-helix transcriptional regulator [Alteromonas sp. a30]MCY7297578.1 helix-turn-helix transcriptional regulator [Alteromonas sp. a30]